MADLRTRLAAIAPDGSWQRSALVEIRATVLAGIWLGALVGGVGGRLAMMVLRLTSSDHVHGVTSDDGFFIGKVTLGGTYSLIAVGAGIGIIGAATFRWVEHWLLGPQWFRHITAGLGAGAVVGSMLVHTDGVDFNVLDPQWLAIAFFVLIPAVFAYFIGPLEHALERPGASIFRGRRGVLLVVVSLLAFPPIVVVAAFVAAITLVWIGAVRRWPFYESMRSNRAAGLVVRSAWAAVAVVGLVGLVDDAQTILG